MTSHGDRSRVRVGVTLGGGPDRSLSPPTVADLFEPDPGNRVGAVVTLHGAAGRREDLTQFAVALAAGGVRVWNVGWRSADEPARLHEFTRHLSSALEDATATCKSPVDVLAWSDAALPLALLALDPTPSFRTQVRSAICLSGYFGWRGEPPERMTSEEKAFFGQRADGEVSGCSPMNLADAATRDSDRQLPIHVVVGDRDIMRRAGVEFHAALRSAGRPTSLRVIGNCDRYEIVSPRHVGGAAALSHVRALIGVAERDPARRVAVRNGLARKRLSARMASAVVSGLLRSRTHPGLEAVCDPPPSTGRRVVLVAGADAPVSLRPKYVRRRDRPAHPIEPRADSIMLVMIESTPPRVEVLSISRDIGVDLHVGYQRLGWALDYGGPAALVAAVRDLTGLPVHHALIVDQGGFESLVDGLGGVDVDIPERLRDRRTGLDLRRGRQMLDGQTALAWVRSRYNDMEDGPSQVLGDAARRERLATLLRSLLEVRMRSLGGSTVLRTAIRVRSHMMLDRALADEALDLMATVRAATLHISDLDTEPAQPLEALQSPFPPYSVTGSTYLQLTARARARLAEFGPTAD